MKKEVQKDVRKFGLLGRNISYSFSRGYFREKFEREDISAIYENFDLTDISELPNIIAGNPDLEGFNVTIPYKEQIFTYLDEVDPVAQKIGAVNMVKIQEGGSLKGYNTDYFGFSEAIKPFLQPEHKKALVLGTGGASKAVIFALRNSGIIPVPVSRTFIAHGFTYEDLDAMILKDHLVIINCTPLGTSPNTAEFPPIPFEFLDEKHLVFDLIYNPSETRLMHLAARQGATVCNGLRMLELQAEKSWELWNLSS
jgi:shikimate dehydrogenase